MTYYGPKELAAAFRTVRGNTIRIAEDIPEEHYSFRPAPESRSVAETLAHIAFTPTVAEQIQFKDRLHTLVGFDFFSAVGKVRAEEAVPRTKSQILELLRSGGEKMAKLLENASDDFLGERVQYPEGMVPPEKTRFEMLLAVKEHEMHHRGQLMVMERILGIKPHLTRQMEERVAAMKAAQSGS